MIGWVPGHGSQGGRGRVLCHISNAPIALLNSLDEPRLLIFFHKVLPPSITDHFRGLDNSTSLDDSVIRIWQMILPKFTDHWIGEQSCPPHFAAAWSGFAFGHRLCIIGQRASLRRQDIRRSVTYHVRGLLASEC